MKDPLAEYQKRDYRTRCDVCKRWMRHKPTLKTPATRRDAPNAGRCTDCPIKDSRAFFGYREEWRRQGEPDIHYMDISSAYPKVMK